MLPNEPLTRDHIVIDKDLLIEDDGINAYIETWFDVDGKFSVKTRDICDSYVNFYATYNPDADSLKCTYVVVSADGDKESEYSPLPEEIELIKAMMNEVCLKEHRCVLSGLWKQRDE